MAHNPKLNIYTLRLNPKDDSINTFRDFYRIKFSLNAMLSDKDVFSFFSKNFIKEIGDKNFRKDKRNKKVIGTANDSSEPVSLSMHSNSHIIEGIIKGGKYGIKREYASTDNKDDNNTLDATKAVLDKYYILICTPLNSSIGYMLIQSYTEESIQDSVSSFMRSFFNGVDEFYNIVIEPYVPKNFVEKYAKASRVSMFSYTSKVGLSGSLRDSVQLGGQIFEVEIKLKPIDFDLNPESDDTAKILEEVGELQFENLKLKNSSKKKAFIKDVKNRQTNYDLDDDISKIKPTIFLEDHGITVDEKTMQPDFVKIKELCFDILDGVKKEFHEKSEVYEH